MIPRWIAQRTATRFGLPKLYQTIAQFNGSSFELPIKFDICSAFFFELWHVIVQYRRWVFHVLHTWKESRGKVQGRNLNCMHSPFLMKSHETGIVYMIPMQTRRENYKPWPDYHHVMWTMLILWHCRHIMQKYNRK